MSPAQLLSHFDRISEAPDAIARLGRFILDLAVQGKLVEQDLRDEPAPELLKRIQAEKERLVKAGEIRKGNPFPRIEDDETPFALPAGWEWVRIRQVTSDRGQATPDNDFTYIDVTAINKEVGRVANAKVLSASDAPSRARKLVRTGDVLYSCVRPYLLNIAVIESDIVPSPIASTAFAVLNGFGLVLSKYLWIVLRSPFMVECVESKMRGQAYPAINDSDFALLPVPLPPLAEQHRIVAKVDELMALCNRLEASQAEQESRRDRLAASSLNRLNNGVDPEAFRDHARFYFNHLPRLTTRHEHLQQLRQTILNLAVSGKLVSQDPTDEPASELLKRIEQAKTQLIAARELRQVSLIANSIDRRLEISIPRSWAWAKCENILFVTKLAGFEYTKHFELCSEGDIPVIRAQNVRPWRIERNNLLYIDNKTSESLARSALTKPCILVTFIGAGIGDVAFFNEKLRWHLAPNVAKAEVFIGCEDLLDLRYLVLFLNSPFGRAEIFKHIKSTAQPSISMGTIRDIDLALPPLAEQQRIVAKVDELMALCDRLEAQLTTTQTESHRLLEATLSIATTA
jgi:type I restriction enzyme S subunit